MTAIPNTFQIESNRQSKKAPATAGTAPGNGRLIGVDVFDHIRAEFWRIINRAIGRYECAECFDSVRAGYYCAGCGRR